MITIKMPGKVWEANVDAIGNAIGEDFPLTRDSREWATAPAPAGRFGVIREATVPEDVAQKVADILEASGATAQSNAIGKQLAEAQSDGQA